MGKDYILDLMRSKKTIFTFKDLILLWAESDVNFVKKKIHRYVKAGKMNAVRRGIYSKDKNYDKYELATKIYTPSYVSMETALGAAGVTFQLYGQIFIASYTTKEIECDGQKYSYKKIKDAILTNQIGIESRENYSIASPERAFLDVIYLNKDYHFDNFSALNWEKVREILPIYNNKRMEKKVGEYFKKHKIESFDTSYQEIIFPENSNIVYIIGFDDSGKFKPFYVGESGRNIGRFGDYISAQFSAQTDFKVGIAVKRLMELEKKVIIKYRNSENKRKEQDVIIRKLRNKKIKLLNDVSGYNYKTANKEAETKKVRSFIDEIAR